MTLLLDHLASIIIAAGVILILGAAQIRAQRSAIEQTASYASKTKALSFGEWIEDDIESLGENFGSNRFRFETPTYDVEGNTSLFTFFRDSVNTDTNDTLRVSTRYVLNHAGEVVRGGDTTDVYQLERATGESAVVDGASNPPSTWVNDGRSLSTLSRFTIGFLDGSGRETTDVETADYVRISFSLVPQFPVEPEYLRELYWSTTIKVRPFWEPPPQV